jgi:hypothetical protein
MIFAVQIAINLLIAKKGVLQIQNIVKMPAAKNRRKRGRKMIVERKDDCKVFCPYCRKEFRGDTVRYCFINFCTYDDDGEAPADEYQCTKCLRYFYLRSDGK